MFLDVSILNNRWQELHNYSISMCEHSFCHVNVQLVGIRLGNIKDRKGFIQVSGLVQVSHVTWHKCSFHLNSRQEHKPNNLINADNNNFTYFTLLLVITLQEYYILEAATKMQEPFTNLPCEDLRVFRKQFSHSRQKSQTYTAVRLSQITSMYKTVQHIYTKDGFMPSQQLISFPLFGDDTMLWWAGLGTFQTIWLSPSQRQSLPQHTIAIQGGNITIHNPLSIYKELRNVCQPKTVMLHVISLDADYLQEHINVQRYL